MRILAVFPHSNGCCTEVILFVLHSVLYNLLFLCFYFFSVYRSALFDYHSADRADFIVFLACLLVLL